MIDVLYVSYSFHNRAQRPRGLAPALVREGFRPIVLHRPCDGDAPGRPGCDWDGVGPVLIPVPEPGYDTLRNLSRSLRSRTQGEVRRGMSSRSPAAVREVPRWLDEAFAFPDRNTLWIRPAVRAGLAAGRLGNPRLVYASAWPVSALVAGRKLARLLDLPLVTEFRDLWVDNPFADYVFPWRRRIDRAWEGRLLRDSARVIVVTGPMRDALLAAHPEIPPQKISVVPNGFGSGDLPELSEAGEGNAVGAGSSSDPRPVLAHVGHLYGRRSPQALLEAAGSLRSAVTGMPFRLRLVGRVSPGFLPMLADGEREGWLERTGPVAYNESLIEMRNAGCLLLLIENGLGAEGVMTGKVFPYLASGRPILALVPPGGVAADVIRRAGAGAVVDPDDVQGIADALGRWLGGTMPLSSPAGRKNLLRAHSWPVLASRLADVLREACETHE